MELRKLAITSNNIGGLHKQTKKSKAAWKIMLHSSGLAAFVFNSCKTPCFRSVIVRVVGGGVSQWWDRSAQSAHAVAHTCDVYLRVHEKLEKEAICHEAGETFGGRTNRERPRVFCCSKATAAVFSLTWPLEWWHFFLLNLCKANTMKRFICVCRLQMFRYLDTANEGVNIWIVGIHLL